MPLLSDRMIVCLLACQDNSFRDAEAYEVSSYQDLLQYSDLSSVNKLPLTQNVEIIR